MEVIRELGRHLREEFSARGLDMPPEQKES